MKITDHLGLNQINFMEAIGINKTVFILLLLFPLIASSQSYYYKTDTIAYHSDLTSQVDIVIVLSDNYSESFNLIDKLLNSESICTNKKIAVNCINSISNLPENFYQIDWIEELIIYGNFGCENDSLIKDEELPSEISSFKSIKSLQILSLPISLINSKIVFLFELGLSINKYCSPLNSSDKILTLAPLAPNTFILFSTMVFNSSNSAGVKLSCA